MLGREQLIAAATKLWGEPTNKKENEWRFGTHGSKSITLDELVWYDHELEVGGGVVELCARAGIKTNGHAGAEIWTCYDYRDESGELLFQVVRKPGHRFVQRRPNGSDWIWNLEGVRRVLYRLPQLKGDGVVFVVEGEKDADNLAALGFVTTCNPGGAGKWRAEYGEHLRDRDVIIIPDNDDAGRRHAQMVHDLLYLEAKSVNILELPDKDVSDWIARGGTRDDMLLLLACMPDKKPKTAAPEALPDAVEFKDFLFCSPENKYIFRANGTLWPSSTVDKRLPWIGRVRPSTIIARDQAIEQMTWLPGEEPLIKHKLVIQGGMIKKPNATMYNLYRGPNFARGNPKDAHVWVDHVRYVYPAEADHIIKWFAHRCQYPHIKIEHALVLGGTFGIGKDTLLEPVLHALGPWNVASVSPHQMLERFNGHLKTVLLVINEARDLGDTNRPQFYERLKVIISSPLPLLIDEKNTHPYHIPNLVGVVYTTNHKVGGMFIAPDDRRHFVAWSAREMEDFQPTYTDYFNRIWAAYDAGARDAIATYLHELDLSDFNPKAPPPKTEAFHEIVMTSRNSESYELYGLLERLGNPEIITLDELIQKSTRTETDAMGRSYTVFDDGLEWIKDRRNRRMIPRWFEQCGYTVIRNHNSKQGLWKIGPKQQMVYGRMDININDLINKIRGRIVQW